MGNEIKIIIGGDASQLTAATKQASESLGAFTGLTNQTAGSLRKVATESANTAEELKKVSKAAENLIPEGSILEARESVKRLKAEIASLSGPQLNSDAGKFLVSELKVAETELKNLEVEAGLAKQKIEKIIPTKLPLGAIEEARAKIKGLQSQILSLNTSQIKSGVGKTIAADIKIAEKELVALEAQAGLSSANTGNLLKQGFSGLRTIANILPGIGVAGIIGFATEPLINYVSSLFGVSEESKKAKEASDELAKSIRSISSIQGEATASVEGQLSQVNALAAAVADSNRPYAERKRALEELKEINKAYFGDLKIEDAATGALTKTVEEYTKALINSAIQKQFVDEIAKTAKAVVDSDADIAKSRIKLSEAQKKADEAQQRTKESFTEEQISANAAAGAAALEDLAKAQKEVATNGEKSTKLLEQEAILRDNLNKTVAEGLKFKDLDADKSKKEEDFLKKRLEALEKIKAGTKDASALVGIQESIFEVQVKIAFRDQGKNQLTKQELDQQVLGFKSELQAAFDKQAISLEAIPKVKFSQVIKAEIPPNIDSLIAKATGLDKKIPVITLHEVRVKILGLTLTTKLEDFEKRVADLKDQIQNTLSKGASDAFVGLGEAFGEAISKGDFGNSMAAAAKSLLSVIGGVMQQLGQHVIVAALKIKLLKDILEKFAIKHPIIAIAGGIALVAAGAALKNINIDVPKLALGGIATGPTLGIFGEAGKEAIIPLDKLPGIVGQLSSNNQSNVVLQPSLRFSLTDMQIGLEKVSERRRRLG